MIGLPPRSVIRESNSKVSGFGEVAFPKNLTQKAGSKENDAKEGECGNEDPVVVDGMLSLIASGLTLTRVALARCTALRVAMIRHYSEAILHVCCDVHISFLKDCGLRLYKMRVSPQRGSAERSDASTITSVKYGYTTAILSCSAIKIHRRKDELPFYVFQHASQL